MSDSLGLVDFAIRLVNSILNWPWASDFFLGGGGEKFKLQKTVDNPAHQILGWAGGGGVGWLVETAFGLTMQATACLHGKL